MRKLTTFLLLLLSPACSEAPDRPPGQYPISRAELERSAPNDSPAEADYRRACLPCHGVDGRGNGGTTGADFTSATGPLTQPDEVLFASVRDGKRGSIGVMPPHGQLMSEGAIRAVIAYVRARYGAGIEPSEAIAGAETDTGTPVEVIAGTEADTDTPLPP